MEPPADEVAVDKWEFPFVVMLTGLYSFYGKEILWGIDEGIADVNAAGGIRGKPMVVIPLDSTSDDFEAGLAMMVRALDMNPLIIWGPTHDSMHATCVPKATEKGIGILAINNCEAVAARSKPWGVGLIAANEPLSVTAMNRWVTKYDPPLTKVVQFTSLDIEGWIAFGDFQKAALEAHGIEVVDFPIPTGTLNLAPFAVKAIAEEPDAMLFTCGPTEIVKTIVELYHRGWTDNTKNCLFECAITPDLWALGPEYLDDSWAWTFYNPDDPTARWQQMLADYRAEFGIEPSFHPAVGYDAVAITAQCFEALKITGDPARRAEESLAIMDWMANCTYDGVYGTKTIVDYTKVEPAWLFVVESSELTQGEMCD
ncbi:MAG: ABC transporter substrate-binding protein, partial [Dehalococcoidia bacterium]|nr:ABC transporter substrate-binding protein [Dehalococcoidia bacterium]